MRKIRPPKDTRWRELFRLTDDGQWVEDDGEPGVAFFGREEREWAVTLGPPLAFSRGTQAYESSEAQRAAMRACCDRYGCANGRRVNGRGEWARATRDGGTGTRQSRGPLTEPASKHLTPSEPGQGSPTSEASSGDERNSPAPGSESGEAGSVSVKDEGRSPDKSVRDDLERVGIYLSWVPPDHAHDARQALARVEAELERLERLRDDLASDALDLRLMLKDNADLAEAEIERRDRELARLKGGLRRIDSRLTTAEGDNVTRSYAAVVHVRQIARSLLAAGLDTVQRTEGER